MPRLVALGDSLTQGFQSGAILRTDWSYPAMIARALGTEFRFPSFPGDGLPLNIEALLRSVAGALGNDLDLFEFIVRLPLLARSYVDAVEDYYERGAGADPTPDDPIYHNLAVWGFQIADCWAITPEYCDRAIAKLEGALANDFAEPPSGAMYRTARRVLNPGNRATRAGWNVLENLRQIVSIEGPIESLIIWLGPNECLGTVVSLELRTLQQHPVTSDPLLRRQAWNLTHPVVFAEDFTRLASEVKKIVGGATQVFIGTVPHVIIPPVTRGIPPRFGDYYEYYARFFATESRFNPLLHKHLTRADALLIDHTIDTYNRTIRSVVEEQGARWHLVDLCDILDRLAVKRNNMQASPDKPLRDYYEEQGRPDHPLLALDPVPSILSLRIDQQGRRTQGGLFSLDGVHPSTLGYGIVAEAFLGAMHAAGVPGADPRQLDWAAIKAADTLYSDPPRVWDDVFGAAEQHVTLWDWVLRQIG